jgi:hypothetical protein
MSTIGLDLAVQAAHKAVVLDEQGHVVARQEGLLPPARLQNWT